MAGAVAGRSLVHMPIMLDPREFAGGRWWTAAEIDSADPALLDPHFGRFIAKIRARFG
jgi:hypothetical protein